MEEIKTTVVQGSETLIAGEAILSANMLRACLVGVQGGYELEFFPDGSVPDGKTGSMRLRAVEVPDGKGGKGRDLFLFNEVTWDVFVDFGYALNFDLVTEILFVSAEHCLSYASTYIRMRGVTPGEKGDIIRLS